MAWPIESAGNVAQIINNFHITINWNHLKHSPKRELSYPRHTLKKQKLQFHKNLKEIKRKSQVIELKSLLTHSHRARVLPSTLH